ncbi:MAG: hypothetical protein VX938_02895 [Myxococcota bacterium]|nr:hypothetical protein [Myxococcota bacterium]MEE2779136.1 hypothetical protein [Myxococcota bacterium]
MRPITLLAFIMTVLFFSGCSRTPTEAYVDMTTSAQLGDQEGFLSGFTERSRDLVGSMISLSEAYGVQDTNPYQLLVFDSVDGERIEGDGERAVLDVRRGGKTRQILMIREDGEWRIDTRELEAFWEAEGS